MATRVKKPRVPRTRAGGTMTEAAYWSYIRSGLRQKFQRYPVKFQVKNANRRKKKKGRGFEYPCALCNDWFMDKDVQVDHIRPCGSLKSWDDLVPFAKNLFCEKDNLQLLCKDCHQSKTNDERKKRKKK